MLENWWHSTKQLFTFSCVIVTGDTESSKNGESNTNCLWGGGSCFLSTDENGEYSWVCYKIQWVSAKY